MFVTFPVLLGGHQHFHPVEIDHQVDEYLQFLFDQIQVKAAEGSEDSRKCGSNSLLFAR